tara:strand:+ start:612 stop:1580 length:969 start_codon:yes stop_codon:yes gene_type:complete
MSAICQNCSNKIRYHSSNTDLFSNKKFDIYFCDRCFIGKTNVDKDFDFNPHYPENYYGKEGKKFNFLIEFVVLFFRYLRSMFCYRFFNQKNIKLLDIGCGRGQFIYLLKKKGWFVFGTETSSVSAQAAKKKVGDESILINKDLNELKNIDTNFNMITLWHVLEHLVEPKKIVDLIEKKLINKGYVVVEVPNFDSFQHLINKNDWIHLDCPRHVTHFTKKGLFSFFDDKKYKIIKSSTLSFEFGFYGMLQSLLNLFVPIPNYLFGLIRKKNAKIGDNLFIKNYLSLFLTIILFLPLSIISVIFELIAVIFNKGGILRIVIQKI